MNTNNIKLGLTVHHRDTLRGVESIGQITEICGNYVTLNKSLVCHVSAIEEYNNI